MSTSAFTATPKQKTLELFGTERGPESGVLEPAAEKGHRPGREDEIASLWEIIQELNERRGANLSEKDRKSLEHLEAQLTRDAGLEASVKANTKDNVRLTFEQKVENHFDEMAESNFKLLKRIVDDRQFGEVLVDRLTGGAESPSGPDWAYSGTSHAGFQATSHR